jgi:hypothetical protein
VSVLNYAAVDDIELSKDLDGLPEVTAKFGGKPDLGACAGSRESGTSAAGMRDGNGWRPAIMVRGQG